MLSTKTFTDQIQRFKKALEHKATTRKQRIVAISSVLLALCAFGAAGVAPMAPDASDLPVRTLSQEIALPTLAQQIEKLSAGGQTFIAEDRIRAGDTLATVLQRLGVNDEAAASFIRSDDKARSLMQLRPGKRVQATINSNGALVSLSTTLVDAREEAARKLVIQREGDKFHASEAPVTMEKRVEMRTAEIRSSLFAATDAAQIPDAIALQLVEMFSTNIDFASDLRRGDRFSVVYETVWQGGEYLRTGRVLAAEFVNAGSRYQSVWFEDPSNKQGGGYYSFDGKSLKKAFLKSPLEFSRVSSGFSMRVHPVSGQWKQHKGVDFAAAHGTPIRAAADGTVDFAGGQGGYGNIVVLKHWSNYSTAYAHMSRFAAGLRKGSRVKQGEVIGYVGSTGWSTGPHLHYEFRVNNEPRNPMSIEVPNAQPLAGGELQRFRALASDMTHRLALLSSEDKGVKLASR